MVYVDEAHIHLDTDEGYGWTVKGKRAWISSSSPGLAKVSFYGIYFYNQGGYFWGYILKSFIYNAYRALFYCLSLSALAKIIKTTDRL
jgi:hypothetical protein